jgi:hypothetical protein
MTTMAHAFKKVNMAVPNNRRIWQWLKDHQTGDTGYTYSQVSKALNIKESSSSSLICDMVKRRMMEARRERAPKGASRTMTTYYRALGGEYELLPLPLAKLATLPQPLPPAVEPEPGRWLPSPPQKVTADKFDLDNLTIGEARTLYLKLKEMFK